MKTKIMPITRYDADDGKVFDWKDLSTHTHEEEKDGETVIVQDHLYAKTLYIGEFDSIDNYIEVDEPEE